MYQKNHFLGGGCRPTWGFLFFLGRGDGRPKKWGVMNLGHLVGGVYYHVSQNFNKHAKFYKMQYPVFTSFS